MTKLVGFDLNGWRDTASRNWQVIPGEETQFGGPYNFSGGLGGSVVTLDGERLVGGIQAVMSPHGRGPGWGEVGNPDRRSRIVDLLDEPEDNIKPLAQALAALAPGGKATGVLTIDDTPEMREMAQEALLNALRQAGMQRGLLVWRPVLAVLSALDRHEVQRAKKIGIVGHCSQGFSTQVLILRDDALPTPERRKVGQLHASGLGLCALLEIANDTIKTAIGDTFRWVNLNAAQSPWRLALGEAIRPEIVRATNSDWEILTPPSALNLPDETLPATIACHLADCDVILFDTPASGTVAKELWERLNSELSLPSLMLDHNAIAQGALEAARRLQKNEPVYYDFLPQISTIVQDKEGARNEDLIPVNARLRAGEVYRSREPAKFVLQQGTNSLSIFLNKENIERPRKATIELPSPTSRNMSVALNVEQKPASGRARLTLVSEVFSAPLIVDWDKAKEQEEDWGTIIESQKPTLPTIPNRLVLPCGMENWENQPRAEGLTEMLERNLMSSSIDWYKLAGKLSMRPEGKYAVSSDGILPITLGCASKSNLNKIIHLAEADVRERLGGKGGNNNNSLRFLTWLFHRCPRWVVGSMIDALAGEQPFALAGEHPFRVNPSAATLLLQGIGRTADDKADQRRAFDYLLKIRPEQWNKNHLACASFLLSRNDNAPLLLERQNIDFLAVVANKTMQESLGSEYTSKFIYAPFLLVGLLRWRLKDPRALVAGIDSVADRLLEMVNLVLRDMANKMHTQPKLRTYHAILLDVAEELNGQGTNPNLLLDIEALA